MKKNFLILLFVASFVNGQNSKKLTFDNLKPFLIDFLYEKNQLTSERVDELKKGEYDFYLRGLFNDKHDGELVNGVYAFSNFSSHSKAFFVLVENNEFTILDLDNREGLDVSIKNILDFSERSKYCVLITSEILTRLLNVFYNKNVNPLIGQDINCIRGVVNFKDLP
ncbi:hypothetical protein [Flavobacterium sp.]|uniref:hypothetical protein n=1 Tax=Flavobacterium sp. TaxID=239 RepID=UPI003D29266B